MKKIRLPKWFHGVMFTALLMPTVYMGIAYTHDYHYLSELAEVYRLQTQIVLSDKYPFLGTCAIDYYTIFINIPRYIMSDKVAQQYIFENYEIDEEKLPLTSAILSLEDEMEFKYDFLSKFKEADLWYIPNDTRILTLSEVILNKPFTEKDFYMDLADGAVDVIRDERGIVAEYEFYAKEFGYSNFNVDDWTKGLTRVTWFYLLLTAEQVITVIYAVILLFLSLRKSVELRRNENDKDKRRAARWFSRKRQ